MKKIAIILVALLALIGLAWFVLTAVIIDSDEMAEELTTALSSATGRDVQVSATSEVALFPQPQVTFNGLKVSNIEGASSPDFISTPRFTLKLDMAALLTGSAKPSEILLEDAVFDMEVLPGGQKNWQFTDGAQQSEGFHSYFVDTPVRLEKSLLRYVNAATGSRSELTDISGTLGYEDDGATVVFNGDVSLHKHRSQVMARMRSVDLTADATPDAPFQLVLDHLGTTFKAQGTLSSATNEPEFTGVAEIDSPNFWGALGMLSGRQPETANSNASSTRVTAKGDITLSMKRVLLSGVDILAAGEGTIPAIKGALDMEYRFGKSPYLDFKPSFETIDMDYLIESYEAWYLADVPAVTAEAEEEIDFANTESADPLDSFLRVATGQLNLQVDSLIYHGRSINDIRLLADMQPRRMAVRQGRANMPGQTRMVFSGLVLAREAGLGFDGKFEMQGREMEQFLSLFTPKDIDVPPLDLGAFGIRTNFSLDAEQFRFSEFQARVAETRMAGAVILRRGDRLKVESYLRIAGINLDTLGKAAAFMLPEDAGVKSTSSGENGDELFDVQYINTTFDWLNGVGVDVDSDFLVQDFVLLGRKGGRSQFHVEMGVGTLVVDKINAEYNGAKITGAYGVRAEQGQNPYIQIDTTISELDMVDLFPDIARSHNDDEWEAYLEKPFEFLPLQTYRADIKAKIGKLNMRDYTFENVQTEINLADSRLTFEKFTGYLWNGGVNLRAAIQAGTIPSLSLSFALENANLVRLSEATALLKHAAGLVGVRGQVTTSGVSPRSWLTNGTGQIQVTGKEISVQGFGISTLARAVPVARQVRDIERAREQALRSGVTRITALNGMINVADGVASTPRMTYSADESSGAVQGSVDLIRETVDLVMDFYLLNTREEGENPPMLSLRLRGQIDSIEKELETQQLENYVSQKAAARALGRP